MHTHVRMNCPRMSPVGYPVLEDCTYAKVLVSADTCPAVTGITYDANTPVGTATELVPTEPYDPPIHSADDVAEPARPATVRHRRRHKH